MPLFWNLIIITKNKMLSNDDKKCIKYSVKFLVIYFGVSILFSISQNGILLYSTVNLYVECFQVMLVF